jgi:hypothetical protein
MLDLLNTPHTWRLWCETGRGSPEEEEKAENKWWCGDWQWERNASPRRIVNEHTICLLNEVYLSNPKEPKADCHQTSESMVIQTVLINLYINLNGYYLSILFFVFFECMISPISLHLAIRYHEQTTFHLWQWCSVGSSTRRTLFLGSFVRFCYILRVWNNMIELHHTIS